MVNSKQQKNRHMGICRFFYPVMAVTRGRGLSGRSWGIAWVVRLFGGVPAKGCIIPCIVDGICL